MAKAVSESAASRYVVMSIKDEQLALVRSLGTRAGRDASGRCLLEGRTLIGQVLEQGRVVVVSEDSDFSALLPCHRLQAPSFVLIRSAEPLVPEQQVALLLNNLPALQADPRRGLRRLVGSGQGTRSPTSHLT